MRTLVLVIFLSIRTFFFSASPVEATEDVGRHPSRQLAQLDTGDTTACAAAIADVLAAPNATWRDASVNSSALQAQFLHIIQSYLASDQHCRIKLPSNGSGVLLVTWMQYPSWHNGIITEWVHRLKTDGETAPYFTHVELMDPEQLPPPAALTDASLLQDYNAAQEELVVVSADMSGFSPSWMVEQEGIVSFTENVCIDKTNPQGPLFPRAFLLLFYRADVLDALYESGHYGLCITTDPNCGRLGDILAAIAASVVQTSSTMQGYVFDLAAAPPAAPPLVNGTAWRYGMEVLRRLLQYNAPDYNTTDSTGPGSFDTAAKRCHAYSPWFASGGCLFTIDLDIAFLWMARVGKLPLPRPAVVKVAPLPGSSQVMDAENQDGSTNESAAAVAARSYNGNLVSCSSSPHLCVVSGNHDALYLTSAGQAPAALAVARDARAKCGVTEAVRMEGAAVAAAATAAAAATTAPAAAAQMAAAKSRNRAPYSIFLDYYTYINYGSFAVVDLAQEMSLIQRHISSRIETERKERQAALDVMRQAAAAAAASGGSGGGNVTVTPGNSSSWNTSSYPATPWFKWTLSHAALELQSTKPGVEAAAAVLSRLFILATEAYSPNTVRTTYEMSINAARWQAPYPDRQQIPRKKKYLS
ncbi:hypothetical protein VOLCADRAFT_95069 [Volvox carteri f. nagariensis]|uniref:Uncharacterized protein n=1 Tax=Volvox carteri f. nagariensis TaxID=3068 RepID=D8U6I3_VOLCA|nr:uncharacterized protein VOLCADRAFT_95069 [Volvox carteri f. nagariensis]EFJ44719.1 hypothetical protein VOLCADRAFT_95069 [Volvox carteri f. nagariensis]|eukprot:XP_002954295.1 hypothetical protein VOLCADRAFT_95069 [Volvox carteri f. nagariensis]